MLLVFACCIILSGHDLSYSCGFQILHMFRKKVHPESSTAAQKSGKHHKNQKKKKTINNGGYNKSDLVHPEEDSSVNREYWIKTDADCKYTKIFHWPISQFNLCYVFKFFIGPLQNFIILLMKAASDCNIANHLQHLYFQFQSYVLLLLP